MFEWKIYYLKKGNICFNRIDLTVYLKLPSFNIISLYSFLSEVCEFSLEIDS